MRLALVLALAPGLVFAAGGGSDSPPSTTKTTAQCAQGYVYDPELKACVAPVESSLDDDALYGAARELAYAGRYGDALAALDAMTEQDSDRVLTYRGFATRKSGDRARGMAFYEQALAVNPDNLLARSYMGQAFVEKGEIELAQAQLVQIEARGGTGTWAERSLRRAIEIGEGYSY